jgi:hypothetical protein
VDLFPPGRARFFSTCQPDMSQVMAAIGEDLQLSSVCLSGYPRIVTDGGGAECVVEDRVPSGDASGAVEYQLLLPCDYVYCEPSQPTCPPPCRWVIPAGASACWFIDEAATCDAGPRLRVIRGLEGTCGGDVAPPGTVTAIQCGTCAADSHGRVVDCAPECEQYRLDRCPTADGSAP